jgi:prepilin peptidase CpaA
MKQAIAGHSSLSSASEAEAPRTERSDGSLFSTSVALFLTACFCSSIEEGPLPQLAGAAAFLFLAIEQDVRQLRIPNWLTFPAFFGALVLAGLTGGVDALLTSLAAAGVAFALLFPAYCLRIMGAGDVKAAMVLGALLGSHIFLSMLWWMVLAGGLMGIVLLVAKGGLRDMLSRWWQSLKLTVLLRRPTYFRPEPGSAAARGIPFAVAMGAGATAYQILGVPW